MRPHDAQSGRLLTRLRTPMVVDVEDLPAYTGSPQRLTDTIDSDEKVLDGMAGGARFCLAYMINPLYRSRLQQAMIRAEARWDLELAELRCTVVLSHTENIFIRYLLDIPVDDQDYDGADEWLMNYQRTR